jgi:predicted nucleic acid-binding Zn ribbon protein
VADQGWDVGMVKGTMARGKKKGPEKVGDVLGGFLRKSGLRDPVLRASAVEEWEDRVGEAIARVTRAQGVREATLIVEVRSSSWLMELNFMKEEILRRVNEDRTEALIEKIVFVLAEDPTQ